MRPTNEEIEVLALNLEIDYRLHRYQNCQRAASMLIARKLRSIEDYSVE